MPTTIPINLSDINDLDDIKLKLNILIEDIYSRHLTFFYNNTAIADIDVSGMAGDALTNGNKINEVLAMLRTAKIIKES